MYLSKSVKDDIEENILGRLRKIEGQVRGLQNMVTENRECEEILAQVRAAQSALKSVGQLVIKSYLVKCYQEISTKPSPEAMLTRLDKVVGVLNKFIGA